MLQEQTIDLTRNDIGLWLLFLLVPLLCLPTRKQANSAGRWGLSRRAIFTRTMIGAIIASFIALALAIWQRTPPHYFTQLRIADDHIALGFRWPKEDAVIPIGDVRSISYWKHKSLRRSFKRVQIDTSTGTYRSFGYNQMADEDYRAIEQLRARIERVASESATNVPSLDLP